MKGVQCATCIPGQMATEIIPTRDNTRLDNNTRGEPVHGKS